MWREASAVKRSPVTGRSVTPESAPFSLLRSSGASRSSSWAQVADRQAIVTTPSRSRTGSASAATRAPATGAQALWTAASSVAGSAR